MAIHDGTVASLAGEASDPNPTVSRAWALRAFVTSVPVRRPDARKLPKRCRLATFGCSTLNPDRCLSAVFADHCLIFRALALFARLKRKGHCWTVTIWPYTTIWGLLGANVRSAWPWRLQS